MDKLERLAQRRDLRQIPPLDRRAVERVQVVQHPHRVPLMQQPLAHMRSDKSRAAGYQEIHAVIMEFDCRSSKFKVSFPLCRANFTFPPWQTNRFCISNCPASANSRAARSAKSLISATASFSSP